MTTIIDQAKYYVIPLG